MIAQLKTGLLEYLEYPHLWVRLQAQNGQKQRLSSETRQSILVLRNEGYSMREIANKMNIPDNTVYYSLHRTVQTASNQTGKGSGRPQCTTEQEQLSNIRVSSLRNKHLTSPQLAASLNSTHKTPVTMSTVKR
jgi:transposase